MVTVVVERASDHAMYWEEGRQDYVMEFNSLEDILDFIEKNGKIILEKITDEKSYGRYVYEYYLKNYPKCEYILTIYDDWVE